MNLLKQIIVYSCLLVSGLAMAAPPLVKIDYPANGETVTGILSIVGWSTGTPPVHEVKFYLDGVYQKEVGYGGTRFDVGNAYPEIPNSQSSGFSLAVNTRSWSNGAHTIGIESENIDDEKSYTEINVLVSNVPSESLLPTGVKIDLSGAKGRIIDGTSLLIEKALVDGVRKSIVLEFSTSTNNFAIVSFTGIPTEGDRDGDRVPDDMDAFPDDDDETSDDDENGLGDNSEANDDSEDELEDETEDEDELEDEEDETEDEEDDEDDSDSIL